MRIWFAGAGGRRSLTQLEELSRVSFTEAQIKDLPLAERWIISKLHTLVDTVDTAFARYDFGAAGSAAYDFFWNEFADWCENGAFGAFVVRKELYGFYIIREAAMDPLAPSLTK